MACTIDCPVLLTPADDATLEDETQAVLTWESDEGVIAWEVYVWAASGSEPTTPTATVYEPTYTATELTGGTEYNWKIKALSYCPDQAVILRGSRLTAVINNFGSHMMEELPFYLDQEGNGPMLIDLNMNDQRITNLANGSEDEDLITKAQWVGML